MIVAMCRGLGAAAGWSLLRTGLLLAWALASAGAQEVRLGEPALGFGGEIGYDCFNPVRLAVENRGPRPVTCDLELAVRRIDGLPEGVPVRRELTLGPGEARVVTMGAYLKEHSQGLAVRCLPRGGGSPPAREVDLSGRRPGLARVYLQGGLRRQGVATDFPEACFPTSAVLCTRLQVVILDHVPVWGEARRRALADWLHAGGRLVLLEGRDGRWPVFGAELAGIDAAGHGEALGAGRVYRLRTNAETLTAKRLAELVPPAWLDEDDDDDDSYYETDVNAGLTESFRRAIRPRHRWWLIHLAMLVFVVLVFPGYWLVARRGPKHHLLLLAGFLGTIAIFAGAFAFLAHPASTQPRPLHSISVAVPLTDGRYLVRQWADLFVRAGGSGLIEHPERGAYYACGMTQQDSYAGQASEWPRRYLGAMLPSYSSFNFTAGFVTTAEPLGLEVHACRVDRDGRVQELSLGLAPAWTAETDLRLFLAEADGERIYRLRPDGDTRWSLAGGQGIDAFLSRLDDDRFMSTFFFANAEELGLDEMFQQQERRLIKAILRPDSQFAKKLTVDGDRRLHLFVCRRLTSRQAAAFRPRAPGAGEADAEGHHVIVHAAWEPGR